MNQSIDPEQVPQTATQPVGGAQELSKRLADMKSKLQALQSRKKD